MKYLKVFESFEDSEFVDTVKNLQEMCDDYLSYLMDEGFSIYCDYTKFLVRNKYCYIEIRNPYDKFFKMSDVEDNISQFLTILKDSYEYCNVVIWEPKKGSHCVNVDSFINGDYVYDRDTDVIWINVYPNHDVLIDYSKRYNK